MPQFSVNPNRLDPYKQFKFRIKWDGRYISGISKVSELKRRTVVDHHREGGEPSAFHHSPGLTIYEPIVLSRGRTHDTAFEEWVNKVWNFGSGLGAEVSLKDFRKDIIIDFYNESGQVVMAFKVFRCWPSEYIPIGRLDGEHSSILYETITLQNEGWERDYEVTEPMESSFTEP